MAPSASARWPVCRELEETDPRTLGGFRLLCGLGTDPASGGTGAVRAPGGAAARRYLARYVGGFRGRPADNRGGPAHGGRAVTVTVTASVPPGTPGAECLRARLRREAATAVRVPGPWVAPLLDADLDAPVPWLAYAFEPALPLSEVVRLGGPLPGPSVRSLSAELREALRALRQAGLHVPGLSPGTLLLAGDGPRLTGLAPVSPGAGGRAENGAGSHGDDVHAVEAVLAYACTGQAQPGLSLPGRMRPGQAQPGPGADRGRQEPSGAGPLVPLPGAVVVELAARAAAAQASGAPGDGAPGGGTPGEGTGEGPDGRPEGGSEEWPDEGPGAHGVSRLLAPPLQETVEQYGPWPVHAVRALGAGVATALAAVHRARRVHGALTPSRVLVSAAGPRLTGPEATSPEHAGPEHAGPEAAGPEATGPGSTDPCSGGPAHAAPGDGRGYLAPEQAEGREPTPYADVFALARVLVFAATGSGLPGPGLAGVPDVRLRRLLTACLARTLTDRPTAAELSRLLLPYDVDAPPFAALLPPPVLADLAARTARV